MKGNKSAPKNARGPRFNFIKKECTNKDGTAYGKSKYCDNCKMRNMQKWSRYDY
jgi:hypothetical protein